MNIYKAISLWLFVLSCGLIIGSCIAVTKIYYWSISSEGLALWMSIAGHIIKIGEVMK